MISSATPSSTRTPHIGAIVLLGAALVGTAFPPLVAAQDVRSYTLASPTVAIYNLAGRTEVVPSTGSSVVVEVTTAGVDGGSLSVAVDEIGGRESLRVIYPEDEIHYAAGDGRGRTQVRVASDGTFGGAGPFFGILGRHVDVSASGGDLEAWADLRIHVPAGRDVQVVIGLGEVSATGVRGTLSLDTQSGAVRTNATSGSLSAQSGSGSLEVRGAEGSVNLDTGSGSISVSDVTGSVDLDTGSGSIDVSDVTGSRVSVDTGSGSIVGERLTLEALAVDTGSGRVRLGPVGTSDVSVDTGSGSVTLAITQDIDRVDVETGSGRVDISLPPEVGADVSVRTGSGGVETEIPLALRTARRNRLEGTFGDGVGAIRVSTGSGGVTIRSN